MSYVALHFVKVNGRMYTEGEIIDEVIDESKKQRLIDKGAIKEIAPEVKAVAAPKKEPAKKTVRTAVTLREVPDDVPDEEPDDQAAVPDIDVMEGIVTRKRSRGKKQ